jgi:rare lipoprotein A
VKRFLTLLGLAVAGCTPHPPAPLSPPHYVLGPPYQLGGVWRYPREQFDLDETGLASVASTHGLLTADGEAFDPTAMAAGHPTLQLPAIARLTDLDTGRQVVVRINDRGPAAPSRILEVTRRVAELLGGVRETLRLRVEVLESESRAVAAATQGEPPRLAVATAAAGQVQAETLAPLPGARQAATVRSAPSGPQPGTAIVAAIAPALPLRLPEAVTQVYVRPMSLYLYCGGFSRLEYAAVGQSRLAALGARIETRYDAPRDRAYQVRVGPLPDIATADAALARALGAGVPDARIILE